MPQFIYESVVPHAREQVFAWHERQGAFQRLTPGWETVRVLEQSGGIRDGARVRLVMKRGPVSLQWRLEHRDFVENEQFVDVQLDGPFRRWTHVHRFIEAPGGATLMRDEIDWLPPGGAVGTWAARPVLERDLRRGFAFRHRRLADDLARHARYSEQPRLTVAITGAGGLIGSSLSALLTTGGHRVVRLVRDRQRVGPDALFWDPLTGEVDRAGLEREGVDAVVHLAGESISAPRWTAERKRRIRDSRVNGTRALADAVASLPGIKTFVLGSAVGWYGGRGDELLTEESTPGDGFLADVCREWEAATRRVEGAGLRTVKIRTGVVLSPAGGALATMLPAFMAGVAGRLGSGRQFLPWIDLDDLVGIFYHALMTPAVHGILNGVAPHAVTNATFTTVLGRVLGRPTLVPVPSLALKAVLGEMGQELLLRGQRALPAATERSGYRFSYEDLETSLRHQLGRTRED